MLSLSIKLKSSINEKKYIWIIFAVLYISLLKRKLACFQSLSFKISWNGENSSAEIYNSCWKGGEIGFFEIGKYRNVKTKSISIGKKDVGI